MSLLTKATIFLHDTYTAIDKFYCPDTHVLPRHQIQLPEDEDFEIEQRNSDLLLCINDIIYDQDHESYRIIDLVGCGSFSKVYKCEIVKTPGTFCALKISRNIPRLVKRLENEYNVLKNLQEGSDDLGIATISRVYKFFHFSGHACVVMDLYQRSLLDHLNYNIEQIAFLRSVMTQLLHTINHIHSHKIAHCDIKPDNIMMVSEGSFAIRLIDFGNAHELTGAKEQLVQPDIYRSPEAHLDLGVTPLVDIWAAGCVAAELVLGFPPFACETPEDVMLCIEGLVGPIPQKMLVVSPKARRFYAATTHGFVPAQNPQDIIFHKHVSGDLFVEGNLADNLRSHLSSYPECETVISFILGLLNPDPEERWTAEKALQHPFITSEGGIDSRQNFRKLQVGIVGSSIHVIPPLSPFSDTGSFLEF